jgi:segregation and condensation protein B
MEIKLHKALEAVLFLKGRTGADLKELAQILKSTKKDVKKAISDLEFSLEDTDSIYVIKQADDRVRLTIKNEVAQELSSMLDRTVHVRLSKSVIETLTIIAYNQPTTKPQIEKVRGVASDFAIRKLLDYELIEEDGRSDLPGNPKLYKTTTNFLELFNMESLDELPNMEGEFEEQTTEMVALFDRDEDEE